LSVPWNTIMALHNVMHLDWPEYAKKMSPVTCEVWEAPT